MTAPDPSGTAGGEERVSTSSLRDRQVVIALTYLAALLDVVEAAERLRYSSSERTTTTEAILAALDRLGSANPQKEDGS